MISARLAHLKNLHRYRYLHCPLTYSQADELLGLMSFVNKSKITAAGLSALLLNRFIVFPSGIFLWLLIKGDSAIAFLQNFPPRFGLSPQHIFSVSLLICFVSTSAPAKN